MLGKTAMSLPVLLLVAGCSGGADEANEAAPYGEPATTTLAAGGPASPATRFASPTLTATPTPGARETAAALATPAATADSASPAPSRSPAAKASPTPAAPATAVAAAGAAPPAFNQCKPCHAVTHGKHGVGPSLAKVFGAKAGHADGYKYSEALLVSGLTWNEASLHAYLTDPRKAVPGTKMISPGVRDRGQRQAIIDYLKTL